MTPRVHDEGMHGKTEMGCSSVFWHTDHRIYSIGGNNFTFVPSTEHKQVKIKLKKGDNNHREEAGC